MASMTSASCRSSERLAPNLSDLLYLRGVDLAIVQSDVLAAVAEQRTFPGVQQQVQYLAKLYDEEVHVFAQPSIEQLSDLAGKLVSMDNRGSGTAMTSTLLFSRLGIAIQPVFDATVKLRRGDIAAMVRVTGKPARFTTPLPPGIRLLPVPLSEPLLQTYLPSQFTPTDYPGVVRFSKALSLKFEAFLQPPRHPKWHDVNLSASLPGGVRFGSQQPGPQPRRV